MKQGSKQLIALIAAAEMLFPASSVLAISSSMSATAYVRTAITLTPTNMQYGYVPYSATPTASSDFVKMGTNAAVTYGGKFGGSIGGATPVAGNVGITGTYGQVLEVACSKSATLSNGSGAHIDITGVEVKNGTAGAAYGSSTACNGSSTNVLSFTLTLGTNDNVKLGGMIDGSTAVSWAGGDYSTNFAGGANITVNITYN